MSALPLGGGYVGLLSWAFRELSPQVELSQQRAMLQQAARLEAPAEQREVECGLELHHDGSGRCDLSFHTESHRLDAVAIGAPAWWPTLVAGSEAPDAAPSARRVRLQGRHWLEFDQSGGEQLRLAGLFQHCQSQTPRSPEAFAELLAHFEQVGCFGSHSLTRSHALRRHFEAFGLAFQWGLMVGRADGLKLVTMLEGVDEATLLQFLVYAQLDAQLADVEQWCRHLTRPPTGTHYALSLDLSLRDDRFAPVIGVEVTGPSRSAPLSAWAGLDTMLGHFGIDGAQADSLRASLAPLPTGHRERLSLGGLEEFLATELTSVSRLAALNHLKLTFRAAKPAAIKTYVSLREMKGAAPTAVPTTR